MISLRSAEEIAAIRRAGGVVRFVLDSLKRAAGPGVATIELDRIASGIIRDKGARAAFKGYKGFPASICASVNEGIVHGIPSKRRLKEGDIVSIDVGVELEGYYADAALTLGIGRTSREASALMAVTEEALRKGIERARPGNRLSDISNAIQTAVEGSAFSVVRAFVGHGIGTKMHEEPEIPNFGPPGKGVRLEPGMVLALEPMVNAGTCDVEILDDGWSAVTRDRRLSAHFEDTIAVSSGDPEVLTG